jgi:hypothetical protein
VNMFECMFILDEGEASPHQTLRRLVQYIMYVAFRRGETQSVSG